MSNNLEHSASAHAHKPSFLDEVGQVLLGEVGVGPKAFWRESDQFLKDPDYLSNHPEMFIMPGTIVSQPLQLGWKALDDGFHLIGDTFSDEGKALEHAVTAVTDPIVGAGDMISGVGELMQGHGKKFLDDELTGIKDLTIDPIWQSLCAVGDALHPIGRALEHPLHAAEDVVIAAAKTVKDVVMVPVHEIEGAFDVALKAPFDLITGNPRKALNDVEDGLKHATIDPVVDGYHAVCDVVNGAAHALYDLL
jgi:hypothetical protein